VSGRSLAEIVERQLEVASLSGEVDAVMQGIVDRLMELPGADGASLSTLEGDVAYFRVTAGADAALQHRTLPIDQTLGLECLRRGRVTVLRASEGPDVDRCLTPGAGAIVLAPIDYDGATRGILGLRSADPDAFDETSVEAVSLLAASAAVAMRNAEVVEGLARSEQHYRELYSQSADATLVSDAEGRLLEANAAAEALFWYSAAELRRFRMRDLLAGPVTDEASGLGGRNGRREELADRAFRRKDGTVLQLEYSARVLDDGRVHTTFRDVTQRRRNEERLRSSLEQLRAIVETQQEISALQLDPEAVTAAIVERTQRLTGADGAVVQWLDGDEFVYSHASGIASLHVGLRLRVPTSLSGRAATLEETLHCPDVDKDDWADREGCRAVGIRSLICAPLYRDGKVDGILAVLSGTPHAFDELAVETTRVMAQFVSTVFQNSHVLETRSILAEELGAQAQVVEHMQTSLWIWSATDDGDFVLQYTNAASDHAMGRGNAKLIGKRFGEVLPGTGEAERELLQRVVDEDRLVDHGEIEYGDDEVERRVFSLKAFPLPGRRVAVSFEDVTDIAHARLALQTSEARFRGAFRSASVGMSLNTLEGDFVQVNERLAEILGYSVSELTERNFRDVGHPDDAERDAAYAAEMRAGLRTEWEEERRYIRKDGSIVWGHASVALVDEPGGPAHVVSLVQDVTQRREAESIFEAVFAQSVVPKLIANDERRLVELNASALDFLGVDRETALTLSIDDLMPELDVPHVWPTFMHDGKLDAETTLRRPDGGARQIEFVATANVRPGRHIAVVRDLSHQKELESQLRQAQKMEAVGRLAGGIAHDFNNLLTAISGYSEFLASGIEDPRLKRHAEEIKKASARAANLTGQLLAFSRRQVLQPRVLDLNAVVSDMDSLLRRLIGEDVELVTMLEPGLPAVQADPTQIEQVIVNLAVNARDAMPNGGSVTIETASVVTDRGSFVELLLTDTGIGMTEEERQQLFDPFFTTKAGGTGLGLATVYGVVEQSGGTIEVDSAPGMGSSFRVWLPSVEDAPEAVAATATSAPTAGSETILLVEDETVVRQLVAEILETTGYTVLQAGDGPSALELLRRHADPVELLVTDVVMPGMSGPEVAKAVTAMRPGMQVLYTSGYTDQAIGHHGVLEPGIAFLQKPFSADDLTSKVRGLLDEPAGVD
jgi:PAS domain S-box-containing protein